MSSHVHQPVQHRDNRPPWCNECGLTATFTHPGARTQESPTDPLIPCLRAMDEALRAWRHYKKRWPDFDSDSPMDYLCQEMPALACALDDLSEIWGECQPPT